MFEYLREYYWNIVPWDYRPSNIIYRLKCFFWHRYRTVKPRTLPGQVWVDREELLIHCCFEILTQFMEKELKGYREEDWAYYYKRRPDELVEFGGHKKDPYYVLDYLKRWWAFYIEKVEKLGDAWDKFNEQHRKDGTNPVENTDLVSWEPVWDLPENEEISRVMFKRYAKKSQKLEQELDNNLVLLIKLRKYLWI